MNTRRITVIIDEGEYFALRFMSAFADEPVTELTRKAIKAYIYHAGDMCEWPGIDEFFDRLPEWARAHPPWPPAPPMTEEQARQADEQYRREFAFPPAR